MTAADRYQVLLPIHNGPVPISWQNLLDRSVDQPRAFPTLDHDGRGWATLDTTRD
jgi:hypothetical protein